MNTEPTTKLPASPLLPAPTGSEVLRKRLNNVICMLSRVCDDDKIRWDSRNTIERAMIEIGKVNKQLPPNARAEARRNNPKP